MNHFTPPDPDYAARVRASFARQHVMRTLGATLRRVGPGEVEIALPYRADLTQQHGFMHAGVIATVLDTACGIAAFTLMPAEAGVLTVEYKINLLSPAAGQEFIARGRVTKPGKTLTVCTGEAIARDGEQEKAVAFMVATMMTILDRKDITG